MWIKSSDCLPDQAGHYLVWWENSCAKDFPTICSCCDVLFWSDKWWAPVSNEYPVTHWMPLPNAPTADSMEGANLPTPTGALCH